MSAQEIRDWGSKQTAKWWVQADQNYKDRQENQPSEDYMRSHDQFNSYLEVGSGTGRLIKLLQGRRGAIDINPYLLAQLPDEITKYNLDITKKMKPIDKYELVYSFQVMQHLDHDGFMQALENIKKIATKEIWLIEGQVPGYDDGALTHSTGSYHHHYEKYLDCYQIDKLQGEKIVVYRSKV